MRFLQLFSLFLVTLSASALGACRGNDAAQEEKPDDFLTIVSGGQTSFGLRIEAGLAGGTAAFIGDIYNAKRDIYAITQSGTKFQTIHPETFEIVNNFGRTDGMNVYYVAQGMGSDDSYVYFPMSPESVSPENINILVACDWEGKYIRSLKIPLTYESESMFYAAGEYYVNFYHAAAVLYRVYPNLEYQSQSN